MCKCTFIFVHSVGSKQFKNLVTHFMQNGLSLRTHGNTKRLPANTLAFSVTEGVAQFISSFAAIHALPLPGRIPGQFSDERVLLLPSEMSKRYVYRQYCSAVQADEERISRRKFENLWCQLLPHISVMKPKTDLCERQVYLYEKIRPYCSSDTMDLTCPKPPMDPNPNLTEKAGKSQRKCSH